MLASLDTHDERAILAAMAYVDLNPGRAGIATTLSECAYTSVARRIAQQADSSAAADSNVSMATEVARTEALPAATTAQSATGFHATGRVLNS